jgi:predicted AAA+ superfamily ATPase
MWALVPLKIKRYVTRQPKYHVNDEVFLTAISTFINTKMVLRDVNIVQTTPESILIIKSASY